MISKLKHFIIEKSFSSCIDFIIHNHSKLSAQERQVANGTIDILNFWKEYESSYHNMTISDINYQWNQFDHYILKHSLSKHYEIISIVAQSIMLDIHDKLKGEPIAAHDTKPFENKILYSKSLLWQGNLKEAFSYISALTRYYPTEAEPWALLGKIYNYMQQREKSILFYREAFFINPTVLNLIDVRSTFLDELILLCYKLLGSDKDTISREDFSQWLGIYGISYQFFNQRRELTEKEEEVLLKRLTVYEKKYIKNSHKEFLNLLRLSVFCYDYFLNKKDLSKSKEILEKIEILSPTVHKQLMP